LILILIDQAPIYYAELVATKANFDQLRAFAREWHGKTAVEEKVERA
jgi:hypothetical protein